MNVNRFLAAGAVSIGLGFASVAAVASVSSAAPSVGYRTVESGECTTTTITHESKVDETVAEPKKKWRAQKETNTCYPEECATTTTNPNNTVVLETRATIVENPKGKWRAQKATNPCVPDECVTTTTTSNDTRPTDTGVANDPKGETKWRAQKATNPCLPDECVTPTTAPNDTAVEATEVTAPPKTEATKIEQTYPPATAVEATMKKWRSAAGARAAAACPKHQSATLPKTGGASPSDHGGWVVLAVGLTTAGVLVGARRRVRA